MRPHAQMRALTARVGAGFFLLIGWGTPGTTTPLLIQEKRPLCSGFVALGPSCQAKHATNYRRCASGGFRLGLGSVMNRVHAAMHIL